MKRRRVTDHHILPRSRGGSDDDENIVEWDDTFHDAYHRMFQNLTLEEAIEMLQIVSEGGTRWSSTKLDKLRKALRGDR